MFVLGMDPGLKSYGVSIVEVTDSSHRIIYTGILENPITDVAKIGSQKESMKHELRLLMGHYGSYPPDLIVMERFTSRGLRGSLGEKIALMMGVVVEGLEYQDVMLVTPAIWKNAANQKFDLKLAYKYCAATPHELDSSAMALYGAAKRSKVSPFSFIHSMETRDKFLHDVEKASNRKLRKIRFHRKYWGNE